jgi:hypothetical protein
LSAQPFHRLRISGTGTGTGTFTGAAGIQGQALNLDSYRALPAR